MLRRIIRTVFWIVVIVGLIATVVGATIGFYQYIRLTRDLPQIERLSDYQPKAVTTIYANDGTLLGEIFEDGGRRYPVRLKDIPKLVKDAFLAAEDADFYNHPGVDFVSILRAVYKNLQNRRVKQGASTITQQVVKSLLLDREKTYTRKAKEAILSYRLEKLLGKDEIFEIYLNEIFLGNTAYGVKAAARVHFHKELEQLNIAEAAFLAGLPQSPSRYMSAEHRDDAIRRQGEVLRQMLQNNMITREQRDAALKTQLVFYPPESRRYIGAEYYVDYAVKVLAERLQKIDRKWTPTNPGGFVVKTAADLKAQALATDVLRKGLREVDKRRGWRGPLPVSPKADAPSVVDTQAIADKGLLPGTVYSAVVKELSKDGSTAEVQVGNFSGTVDFTKSTWANRLIDKEDHVSSINVGKFLKRNQIIEVSLAPEEQTDPDKKKGGVAGDIKAETGEEELVKGKKIRLVMDQTPQLEGAFVLQNVLSGEVNAIVGGYDYRRSVFNRATQGARQPGSSFKPFVYLTAIDRLGYTPSTIVPDSPISMVAGDGKLWTPGNYDGKFLGPITMRTALQRSRNVVSVYLTRQAGLDHVIESARKLGITSPIGRDMSISLGTSEMKLIEMVRAYSVFADGGLLTDEIVVKSIRDRDGKILEELRPQAKQAISEDSAFLMANMMKGVVDRGTATVVKKLGKPVAGKTGTTNEEMDTWFIGYTPEWCAGVWVGFDVKKRIGSKETGGRVAAPIFLHFMEEYLKDTPALDFVIPDGVIPMLVNLHSGRPTSPDDPAAFVEYFKSGSEPTEADTGATSDIPKDYLLEDEF